MNSPAPGTNGVAAGQLTYQERLANWCRSNGYRPPNWQIISDRRGGRTAWSCTVTVQGQTCQARFWYDGAFVNNAKEDASERALQMLGVIPPPPVPPQVAQIQQQQHQSSQQPQQPQQQQQQQQQQGGRSSFYYGAVSG